MYLFTFLFTFSIYNDAYSVKSSTVPKESVDIRIIILSLNVTVLRIFFMLLFASFFGMSLVISSSNFRLDEKNKSKHKVANSINIPISLFDLIYLYRL